MLNKNMMFSALILILSAILLFWHTGNAANKNAGSESKNARIILEGIVSEVIVSPRTLSEYRYYVIQTGQGKKTILFNKEFVSYGFEKYINKKVRITGIKRTGSLGWRKNKTEGVQVLKITYIKDNPGKQ